MNKTCNWMVAIALSAAVCQASTVNVTFAKLTGLTGGSPAGTAVYAADLSGVALSSILSITIMDNSSGLGGATGQFSGFDLDAIGISATACATAACAAGLAPLPVFNFSPAGTLFTPGTQRAPVDPKLFGTDASGTAADNSFATLGAFDGNDTTTIPGAMGFVSMGDNGIVTFNLTSPVSPAGKFLYIGEVGDNGEVAAGQIVVSDTMGGTPEPSTWLLIGVGMITMGFFGRRTRSYALETAAQCPDYSVVRPVRLTDRWGDPGVDRPERPGR